MSLALTAIAIASPACSSHDRIAVEVASLPDAQLNERAWRILEQIELGAIPGASRDIEELKVRFAHRPSLRATQALLSGWLEKKRLALAAPQVSRAPPGTEPVQTPKERVVQESSDERADAPAPAVPQASPGLSLEAAEALKQQGIQLYSEGKVAAALECWQRVLVALPDDKEARKLANRAETVLTNQGNP